MPFASHLGSLLDVESYNLAVFELLSIRNFVDFHPATFQG
jgi:hypothetical protein